MIKREGDQWILYNSTGEKVLGRHPTRAKALAQERAVQISKARAAGHRIPRRRKKS